ncbi:MAG TPA: universal stress protein, partial [Bryobacteraceae bacterium]|nr:universal stress protein [Bryobacteraceae bacterium]
LEEEPASRHVQIRKIVCALDLERESLQVLQSAVSLSRKFSAELTLVHCVAAPESGPAENFLSEFDRFLADTARKRIAELQAGAGTDFEVFLEGGSISATVRDAARRYGADLVVIGRGHAQAAFSRLRSNAFAIIRQSPCPVLSL